jgi:hypothetical protein
MIKQDAALLASLMGFTPGPHQVSGVRINQAPKLGPDARFMTIGPDDDAVALVFFDMKTGRGHQDAKLYAAAPDLHRIATERAAENDRLRDVLADVIGHLDDPHGGEHVRDMRGAQVIARAGLTGRPHPATDARHLAWAVGEWHASVAHRPLRNIYRRALDDIWRQVIRRFGGDDVALVGPRHDDLVAGAKP